MVARLLVVRLLVVAVLALSAGCATASPTAPEPTAGVEPVALSAELTQDSRDTAATRIAVIVTNDGAREIAPEAIQWLDPRLVAPLVADRLRPIPPGGQRRFPLPLVDPVCDTPAAATGRLVVRVASSEVAVSATDAVGVVDRWAARRCAELALAAVAPLEFSEVLVAADGRGADLVLTATPTGVGRGTYVIESVAGTPVFTSRGEPWAPQVQVSADGAPVRLSLAAWPARCDGHVFGESASATAFLVRARIGGEPVEVLVRMTPEVAGQALDFAIEACRAAP